MAKARRKTPSGIGTDSSGGPLIDPTQNVKDLTEAANVRQDDLRQAERRYFRSELRRVQEMANAVRHMAKIHQRHDYALHKAEAGRLDALRQNDREDVKALAALTTSKAEALQAQVAQTAKTLADSFAAAMSEQNKERRQNKEDTDKRLSALELAQSEGRGKATVESPLMAEALLELKAMRLEQGTVGGQKQGADRLWQILTGLAILALAALAYFK